MFFRITPFLTPECSPMDRRNAGEILDVEKSEDDVFKITVQLSIASKVSSSTKEAWSVSKNIQFDNRWHVHEG